MEPASQSAPGSTDEKLKIYLLPNLFTAGNLFCGFLALTRIVEADPASENFNTVIRHALGYILIACILDLLDGRVARMGGFESPFGREFDSLADIVSFGVAPAFLVHRIVLKPVFAEHPEIGWFIASLYVICGAFRLARFNCLAAMSGGGGGKYFLGFPIPAAAGMVASLTMLLLHLDDRNLRVGNWRYALPVILVLLSVMMVSEVKYPTFKKLDWRTQRPFVKTLIIVLAVGFLFLLWQQVLPYAAPLLITSYLVYGFVRPSISRRMQREIEVDDEPDEDEPADNGTKD
ncbi:MAG TPA: CDP-diacylglycerol--serine O-phosphatidyltransferase [Candidatus Limnocylindria bacterium]|jgi:CDP-diacylglycerol--serine O-phosphatidyltransferase|nr:CDP-diacylglycerol--serine O-phosphatidyltransferase [Candidatus Limnocylindria bacterium]